MNEQNEQLPNSSTSTRECFVACCKIDDVSLNSTKNVLSPVEITYRFLVNVNGTITKVTNLSPQVIKKCNFEVEVSPPAK